MEREEYFRLKRIQVKNRAKKANERSELAKNEEALLFAKVKDLSIDETDEDILF